MKKRIHEIDLEIYPRKIWVVDLRGVECIECYINGLKFKTKRTDGTFRKICDGYKSDYFDNVRASVIEAISSKNDIGTIVFLLNPCDISSLVHESVHIADYIFESLGVVAQGYSGRNEQYAYLVEYIFNKINQVYDDIKKG